MNSNNSKLTFALRALRRDWRLTELRILALALVVSVASLSAVGFFTSRIERAMETQASDLIGGDLVVSSRNPLPSDIKLGATLSNLKTANTLTFRSMAVSEEDLLLTEVKAVSEAYPLRGILRISEQLFGGSVETDRVPAPGHVWVGNSLLSQLELELGDLITLGEADFILEKVLVYEPDRGGDVFQMAPRVMMNYADIEKTGLIAPGSRATYRLLMAGEMNDVAAYKSDLEAQESRFWSMQSVRDGRSDIGNALTQAERFLSLAALAAVILAGAAVAVSAQRFAQHQADASAIMRCLGASQTFVSRIYLIRILTLGLLAGMVGCGLGYLVQMVLSALLADFFLANLPPPSLSPILLGMATAMATLIGFALPAVLRIKSVPPLRVLRRDLGMPPASIWQVMGLATLALIALIYWQSRDAELAVIVLFGIAGTLLVLLLAAFALVKVFGRLRSRAGIAWRFGLANLARRARGSAVQLAGFGLGIMALLLLAIVRVDLLGAWQTNLPENAPNHFMLNVQGEDAPAMRDRFAKEGIEMELYPMIPGHLVELNSQPITDKSYEDEYAKRMANRAFNLSWTEKLPEGNVITDGEWWTGPAQASMEAELAQTLRLKVGDVLSFQVADQRVDVTLTSLRELDWESLNVNFFVVLSPDTLSQVSALYISSFHLPEENNTFLTNLVRSFPSITVMNVKALMEEIRTIMDRATLAVEFVFSLTLLAGVLVLYAAIQASREERLHEGAILRTLGAGRRQVLAGIIAEFTTLGALAGLLAATVAAIIANVLAVEVFELPYQFNIWLWIIGISGGALGVGLAGIMATRSLLDRPPSETLRLVT
ncbi:MAG: FtsX-like permease family protein [Pseudomonadota bacterium]